MIIPVKVETGTYNVIFGRGTLASIHEYIDLSGKSLVVTDSGVPKEYSEWVAERCSEAVIVTVEQGEPNKNMDTYKTILAALVKNDFTRTDRVIAVGGGVVGDMAGFAAATYMRGIKFYNIPTTVLSQVDSSVGGKTAVDFMGFKNIVGAFYPPEAVIIDPDTLRTLPARQISNGLAETVKMAATCDAELFSLFESCDALTEDFLDKAILGSVMIKKNVVEADEKETGLRRVLNFGHTIAHAIESVNGMGNYFHGECVSMGMLPMCSESAAARLKPVLKKLGLPTEIRCDPKKILEACRHDKKLSGKDITVVFVPDIGRYELRKMPFSELESMLRNILGRNARMTKRESDCR